MDVALHLHQQPSTSSQQHTQTPRVHTSFSRTAPDNIVYLNAFHTLFDGGQIRGHIFKDCPFKQGLQHTKHPSCTWDNNLNSVLQLGVACLQGVTSSTCNHEKWARYQCQ